MSWTLSEIERRLANLVRVGTVAELDDQAALVRVEMGGVLTDWLPWLTYRAGEDRTWWAPEPGEQVLLLAPSGELSQAVVLPSLYQTAYPPPAEERTKRRTVYRDGTFIEYDRQAHHLYVNCVGSIEVVGATTLDVTHGGSVTVTAPDTTINTEQTHNGNVTINGNLRVNGMTKTNGFTSLGTVGGAGASITGDVQVQSGDVDADGITLKTHVHPENDYGGPTGTAQ